MSRVVGNWLEVCAAACTRPVLKGSLKIAAVVGTILNVINQYDRLLNGSGLVIWSVVFNYLVPFCVATLSAALQASRANQQDRVARNL